MMILMRLYNFRLVVVWHEHPAILFRLPTTGAPMLYPIWGVGYEYGMWLEGRGTCKMEEEP
jgi:hypothetical protein